VRGRRAGGGGPALLPWLTGLTVLLVPVMTADFSLRYVVPALPAVSLAAAHAFLRAEPRTARAPRPAQRAQRAGAAPRARIQRVSREHPAETTPCNYRVT
jgi:hypothetical protein